MIYLIITLVLVICAISYLKIATYFKIIDKPNERSSHVSPTIRGGGILFFIAALLFFFNSNFQYPYFILGISLIAAISFIDDLITLGFKIRLLIQFISLGLIGYELCHILPNSYLLYIVLLIACVGLLNIYNFMDGINGITGLVSLSTLLGFFVINEQETVLNINLIIFPILSILVFGYFNFRNKAMFFAGDVGSISMAMVILFLGIHFSFSLQSPVIILLLGVYITDGVITIVKRLLKKENIFKPHRSHLYQTLVQKTNLSHLKVAGLFAVIQLILVIPVYYTVSQTIVTQIITSTICFIFLGLFHLFVSKKISQ